MKGSPNVKTIKEWSEEYLRTPDRVLKRRYRIGGDTLRSIARDYGLRKRRNKNLIIIPDSFRPRSPQPVSHNKQDRSKRSPGRGSTPSPKRMARKAKSRKRSRESRSPRRPSCDPAKSRLCAGRCLEHKKRCHMSGFE